MEVLDLSFNVQFYARLQVSMKLRCNLINN